MREVSGKRFFIRSFGWTLHSAMRDVSTKKDFKKSSFCWTRKSVMRVEKVVKEL